MTVNTPINMYEPTRDYHDHKTEFDIQIQKVINDGLFINGPEVKELETQLQSYLGVKYAISCASGTDALYIALMACGIKTNHEVITVSHTWISTSETIALTGATPVFIDVTDTDFNIDISKIEDKINTKTKAILFVSLYGLTPNLLKLREIADKHKLILIEDGAQSFGAEFNGTKSCSCAYTDIATSSFFPSKPLGCWGDGGLMTTNNDELAVKMKSIKNHGGLVRFVHKYIGTNSRLDTIQAGILLIKLKRIDEILDNRIKHANYYTERLNNLSQLRKPLYDSSMYKHVWAQYSLLCQDKQTRDALLKHLRDNCINVGIYYPTPLHKQECFSYLTNGDLSTTERICDTLINLPCYGEITFEEQDYIMDKIEEFYDGRL